MMRLAWYVARLNAYAPANAAEFTNLDSLLYREPETPGKQQSGAQQLAIVKGWIAARNGKR